MVTFVQEVGHRLKVARVEARMSQEDVAKRMGTTRMTVSNIETGALKGGPNVAQVFAFCDACHCKPDQILRSAAHGIEDKTQGV